MSKAKPTSEQIHEAVDTLGKWFPEEAHKFALHREAIVNHIVQGTSPAPGSPLATMKFETIPESETMLEAVASDLTPCERACGVVAFDAVLFVLGLLGLRASNNQKIANAMARDLGGTVLNGFKWSIKEFKEAKGAMNKARALFTLVDQIWNAGCFSAVFNYLKNEMSWWDWLKTGLTAVAQMIAWIATDGAAFYAEAALSILNATELIEDAAKAVVACY